MVKDRPIRVQVMPLPVTALYYSFSVTVTSPVEMPTRLYSLSLQEVLVKATNEGQFMYVLYELLEKKILEDYNRLIEDCPILDMFDDPNRFQTGSRIEFDFI
jgi:hypothetical protein